MMNQMLQEFHIEITSPCLTLALPCLALALPRPCLALPCLALALPPTYPHIPPHTLQPDYDTRFTDIQERSADLQVL